MLASSDVLTVSATVAWFGEREAVAGAGEIAAAMLLQGPAGTGALGAAVHTVLAERFQRADGSALSLRDCEYLLGEWLRPGNSLGFVAEQPGNMGHKMLSHIGRAAVLMGLAYRAHCRYVRPACAPDNTLRA